MEVNSRAHLEGMFKDIDLSHEVMQAFRQSYENDAHVKSSRAAALPTCSSPSGMLAHVPGHRGEYSRSTPKNLQNKFQNFYLGKHSGRKLTWQNSQGPACSRRVSGRP